MPFTSERRDRPESRLDIGRARPSRSCAFYDCCRDAAKTDRKRRDTLTRRRRVVWAVNLCCKHGWRSHLTARPKVLWRRQFELSPKASSSTHSVAAGPGKVDHPVDVPRRIARPGVLESAMPTASCVSLCESCGLMMNPASKVGARGGNT